MAEFSNKNYDTKDYIDFRPNYSAAVFNAVLDVFRERGTNDVQNALTSVKPIECIDERNSARGIDRIVSEHPNGTLVDLGCGPGQVVSRLSGCFSKAYGIDPSPGMIAQAKESWRGKLSNVEFHAGFAEKLGESTANIADSSVDIVTAGEAAHWFDYGPVASVNKHNDGSINFDRPIVEFEAGRHFPMKSSNQSTAPPFWREMNRVLKPGGIVCLFAYVDIHCLDNTLLNSTLMNVAYGKDQLASYWSIPGRMLLRNGMYDLPLPQTDQDMSCFDYTQHFALDGEVIDGVYTPDFEKNKCLMCMEMTLGEIMRYCYTYSAFHNYITSPTYSKQTDKMLLAINKLKSEQNFTDDQKFLCGWSIAMVVARKRS